MQPTRRRFIGTAAVGGAMVGLGDLSFLARLPRVSADEAKLDPNVVRLRPEIEPLVRLVEETPRERLLEEVGARVQKGLAYKEVLAALLLAGVRNVQPRPVGFKFHAVLVVNSAHIASVASPETDRWLPIFWALDYFKDSQARDKEEGDWTMGPVDERALPPADKARQAFADAMDNWDEAAADVAVVALARSGATPKEMFEVFCRYGARDFRDIGHKAIYVANAYRTLEHIGWQHAEPVLRSLAYALLEHEGDNPAKRDAEADRPGRRNQELAGKIGEGWLAGKGDEKTGKDATERMLAVLREGSADEACDTVVELLNRGGPVGAVWDAILDGSAELLMRRPGIVALHAVTSANALHFAFANATDDRSKRMMLLQNAAFLPMFREAARNRGGGGLGETAIEKLEPVATAQQGGDGALEEIFADVSGNKAAAAGKVLAYLQAGNEAKGLIDAARRLLFLKGNNAHDYKFCSAVLEDYHNVSPAWRDRFLAASVYSLRGSGDADNDLVKRTRAAVGAA